MMNEFRMLGMLTVMTLLASTEVQATKTTSAGVVPPVGSTCEADKSGKEQHCTFPDGSKWTCNMDLTKCHRTQRGAPSTSLPMVKPSGMMADKPGEPTMKKPAPVGTAQKSGEIMEGATIKDNRLTARKGYSIKKVSSNQVIVTRDPAATAAAGITISCTCGSGSGTCKITKKSPTGGLFCENGTCSTCGWSEVEGLHPHMMPRQMK